MYLYKSLQTLFPAYCAFPAHTISQNCKMDNAQDYAKVSLNTPCIELLTYGFPSHTHSNAELHLWSGNLFCFDRSMFSKMRGKIPSIISLQLIMLISNRLRQA